MKNKDQTILPEPKRKGVVKIKVDETKTIYTTRKKIKEAGDEKKYIELWKERVNTTYLKWN